MLNILEQKSTSQLDEILQNELHKDPPDGDLVREILRILEAREKDNPVEITPQIQAAWDKFKAEDQRRTERVRPTARSWVIRAASVAAVLCLLLATVIPQPAQAETLWERIMRFTDSVFEFFSSTEENEVHSDYVFKTDNQGLQEVYDAVVALGVTEPVVPMWIPEGYELAECKIDETFANNSVTACFRYGEDRLVYKAEVLDSDAWREYHKDEISVEQYELNGVIHNIMQNNGLLVVIWTNNDAEFFLSMECKQDEIYRVVDSIYSGG